MLQLVYWELLIIVTTIELYVFLSRSAALIFDFHIFFFHKT